MAALIMEAERTGYSLEQIHQTMTVGELIAFLEDFDMDTPIYTSQDNGYTYGGVSYGSFRECEEEEAKLKFYFYDRIRDGEAREMNMDEVRQHLSIQQIEDAIDAKEADPNEEVSYMTRGGYIVVDFEQEVEK